MKVSASALASFAVTATLCAAALSGCSGGGSSAPVPPSNAAPVAPAGSNGASIGQLTNLQQPASTTAVAVTSSVPESPNVDTDDAAATAATLPATPLSNVAIEQTHAFRGSLQRGASSSARAPRDVAVNSPLDLTYFGGPVLGSAVSHDIFVNCDNACRAAEKFDPGSFLTDLGRDEFTELLFQYLVGPGVTHASPLTGRFTHGNGVNAAVPAGFFDPPVGTGTNPSLSEQKLINLIFFFSQFTSAPNGGFGHIFHIFLPKNVDTCFPGNTTCYSPDSPSTFVFCGYHGSFSDGQQHRFLFTVEPFDDVRGCSNITTLNRPNQLPDGSDPADASYSVLSHELFETITDPRGNAWVNGLLGNEIGDICSSFDNFVTLSNHRYILQSEYSDIDHVCVSGNLTGAAQTPQH